jgi:hypothetical protein
MFKSYCSHLVADPFAVADPARVQRIIMIPPGFSGLRRRYSLTLKTTEPWPVQLRNELNRWPVQLHMRSSLNRFTVADPAKGSAVHSIDCNKTEPWPVQLHMRSSLNRFTVADPAKGSAVHYDPAKGSADYYDPARVQRIA